MATPSDFRDANRTFTAPAGMSDCQSLRVQDDGTQLLSCWRLSVRERISALVFGRAWLAVSGSAQPPVWVSVERDPHGNASDWGEE